MKLSTSLHTQTCFEGAAALALINPDETDERSASRHLRAVDGCPTTIRRVISNLGAFCRAPPDTVLCHRLLACAWISGNVAYRKGAARTAPPDGL
eukprot:3410397-Pleurochrysis_carterae.AAC.1